jgi:hypothetical protein
MKIKIPTHDSIEQVPISTEDYICQQKLCGLMIGDRVIITRHAKNYEGGWRNVWTSKKTFDEDGIIHTITAIFDECIMCEGFSYPFFVLQRVYGGCGINVR